MGPDLIYLVYLLVAGVLTGNELGTPRPSSQRLPFEEEVHASRRSRTSKLDGPPVKPATSRPIGRVNLGEAQDADVQGDVAGERESKRVQDRGLGGRHLT